MIAHALVQEIHRLLTEEKLSQRQVARRTGVSRGTVGRIANGQRPDYPPGERADEALLPAGPPERCPSCGAMACMPCLLCRLRNRQRRLAERLAPADSDAPAGVEFNLNPEHRARYEQIRVRIAQGERGPTSGRNVP